MKKYVLGFAFDEQAKDVILIEKLKPEWQKDKLNGVGGKVEAFDKNAFHSMAREFKEETGVDLGPENWLHFACLKGDDYEMQCFRIFSDEIYNAVTIEGETIYRLPYATAIASDKLIPSVKVLLPMARDENFGFAEIKHIGKD